MSYCNRTDIENVFGQDNVAIWSNLDNDGLEADETRIAAAIAFAAAHIDARMHAGRYALPLRAASGQLTQITDLAARLAGIWLYEARARTEPSADAADTSRFAEMRSRVDAQLSRYLAGADHLPAVRRTASPDSPVVA